MQPWFCSLLEGHLKIGLNVFILCYFHNHIGNIELLIVSVLKRLLMNSKWKMCNKTISQKFTCMITFCEKKKNTKDVLKTKFPQGHIRLFTVSLASWKSFCIYICRIYNFFFFAFLCIFIFRSEKLRPFWLSIPDEDLSTLHFLAAALLSRQMTNDYKEALSRALDVPECKVVPFFGVFLRDLRALFITLPSVIVLPSEESQSLEVCCHTFVLFVRYLVLIYL